MSDLKLADGRLAVRPRRAAELLDVSLRTLFSLTKRGEIRAVKLGAGKGAGVLYPIKELQRFLDARLSGVTVESQTDGEEARHG